MHCEIRYVSVAFCRYPAEITWQWRPEDWGANRFISALKSEPFNGYADIRILGRAIRVNAASAPRAAGWFADLAYDHLANHQELEPPFFFVPTPDSGCALKCDTEPRMLSVAQDLAARFGGRSQVCDIVRVVASLDRKRLGQIWGASGITIRGVFDEETRRKPLAFAADAVRYGI